MYISFLLPSKFKDVNVYAGSVITSINNALSPFNIEYEILVYSETQPPNLPYVKWIPENEQHEGCIFGYNTLYQNSTGKYIYIISDDTLLPLTLLNAIFLLESSIFKNRTYKVTSLESPDPYWDYNNRTQMPIRGGLCASPEKLPIELQNEKYLLPENRYSVMWFPVFAKETVEKHLNGYIYNPEFKQHYPDNYLGFFLGEFGHEKPIICPNTRTHMMEYRGPSNLHQDYDWNKFCELAVKIIRGEKISYV